MLYVISFLAPYTRISSKQNADAISKGYQFMQQFTLPLKASLASEAQALEGKFGEVLCYLVQLSPSALLQCSHIRLPFADGKGRCGSTQLLSTGSSAASISPAQPEDPLTRFARVKAIVWDWTRFNSWSHSSLGHYLQERKKQTKIHLSCPRDGLELLLMGDALLLCQCALTNWCFSSCSLQTLLRSTTHNCPIISQKSHRGQQEAAAGGMETSLSSPFAGKVIWSLKLWTQPPLYTFFTALTSKYLISRFLV